MGYFEIGFDISLNFFKVVSSLEPILFRFQFSIGKGMLFVNIASDELLFSLIIKIIILLTFTSNTA